MKSFDTFSKEKQFDEIQKLFGITDDDSIYNEIKLLKTNSDKSILYNIIKKEYNYIHKQDIMRIAMKFIQLRYFDVLNKYKKDVKLKNKPNPNISLLKIPYENSTLKVPSRIGHNYIPIRVLPMSDLEKFKKHRRLKVFYYKGLKCVSCPKEGKYLIKSRDRFDNIHIDVYTKDFKLMTIDHIKPKSKGGTYALPNLDPMCTKCNFRKGNFYEQYLIREEINLSKEIY